LKPRLQSQSGLSRQLRLCRLLFQTSLVGQLGQSGRLQSKQRQLRQLDQLRQLRHQRRQSLVSHSARLAQSDL
jgi:hypothetical protein